MRYRLVIWITTKASVLLWMGATITAVAADELPAPYQAGYYWDYLHEGPRPGSFEPKGIGGQRIVQVLGQTGTEDEACWVIEERFTNDPNVVSRLHIRSDRMVTAMVIGNKKNESLTLAYDNPIPHQFVALEPGGHLRHETALVTHPGDYKLPITVEIDRLADETVETPAGNFAGCRHYRSVTESLFNIKIATIAMKEQREWWTSDVVGATVKEIYRKEPIKFGFWSKEGYTATSTLTEYGVRKISGEIQPMKLTMNDSPTPVQTRSRRPWKGIWAVAIGMMAGVVWFTKRHRQRTIR